MVLSVPLYITFACTIVATYVLYLKWLRSKYPPGPWPLPIIGNLDLRSKSRHVNLTRLSKIYGPIFTMWTGPMPTVIVCSREAISEVLHKRGVDFAGRPTDTKALKALFFDNEELLSRSYDEKVKLFRKLGMSIMREKGTGGLCLEKVVEDEVRLLLESLKNVGEEEIDANKIIQVPIANAIMRSIFNFRFKNERDEAFLEYVKQRSQKSAAIGKAFFVDVFWPLWYLLPSVRKEIYESSEHCKAFIERFVRQHEETYQEGAIRDFTDAVIKHHRGQPKDTPSSQRLTRLNVIALVSNMVEGGTESTTSAIIWSVLVLLLHPNIQEKIYQELDKHLLRKTAELAPHYNNERGFNRLLFDHSDRPFLPYLNAFIHELLRRCPILPLGGPHQALVDTCIGRYSIPKGTGIRCNIYACAMDEADWPKPSDFVPERFLDANGDFDKAKAKLLLTFGAGVRSCIGENLARRELFICLANVVHCFKLCPPSDQKLPTLDDVVLGFTCSPMPYRVKFKLRNC